MKPSNFKPCAIAVLAAASLATAGLPDPAHAGDVGKGRHLAAAKCQMCHGLDGVSKLPQAPNLAGQVEPYLIEQMKAFHDGIRKNEMMSQIAPGLSDSEIQDLAAYYAAIEVTIAKIPGE
ncbi:MAG: c-type cytochrome [Rhodopseudomonas sp.]|nr:c-type cytochrome [Rhodopseudomonas sp.]